MTTFVLVLLVLLAAWWLVVIALSVGIGLADAIRAASRSDLLLFCLAATPALCVYTLTGMKSWAFLVGLFVALPCLIFATKRADTVPIVTASKPSRRTP